MVDHPSGLGRPPETTSTRLALIAAGLALVTSVAWVIHYVLAGEAEAGIVALLAVPVVLTGTALGLRRTMVGDATYLVSAVLLMMFVGLFGLSFDLSYLPAAVLSAAAAAARLTERRLARAAGIRTADGAALPGMALVVSCVASVLTWLDAWYAHRQGDAGHDLSVVALVLLLPIAAAGIALALYRGSRRKVAHLAAGAILLVFVLAALPSFLFAVLYVPAIVLLVVSGLREQGRFAKPLHNPGNPSPRT